MRASRCRSSHQECAFCIPLWHVLCCRNIAWTQKISSLASISFSPCCFAPDLCCEGSTTFFSGFESHLLLKKHSKKSSNVTARRQIWVLSAVTKQSYFGGSTQTHCLANSSLVMATPTTVIWYHKFLILVMKDSAASPSCSFSPASWFTKFWMCVWFLVSYWFLNMFKHQKLSLYAGSM